MVHWAGNPVTIKARGSPSFWPNAFLRWSSWVQMPSTKLQFIIGLLSTIMAVGRSLGLLKFASQWHDNSRDVLINVHFEELDPTLKACRS